MGVKYCAKGHKATYTVNPPTECPYCKEQYAKAFISAKPVTSEEPAITRSPAPVSKPSPRYRPAPPQDNQDDNDSEGYDKEEMQLMAMELAASVGSMFQVEKIQPEHVKLGEVMKNPDAYDHLGQRGSVQVESPKPTE